MRNSAIFSIIVAAALSISCAPKPPAPPAAPPPAANPGTVLFQEISNPDEAISSIYGSYGVDAWKAGIDRRSAITPEGREAIAFQMGARSANAVAAALVEDYAEAEKIAGAIKDGAARLNIVSGEIETLVGDLAKDLKSADGERKKSIVRARINAVQAEVLKTFDNLGNEAEATMIKLGAWLEGLRIVSDVVKAEYKAEASSTLNRAGEALYFKSQIASLNAKRMAGKLDSAVAGLEAIAAAMVIGEDRAVSPDRVAAINAAAASIVAALGR